MIQYSNGNADALFEQKINMEIDWIIYPEQGYQNRRQIEKKNTQKALRSMKIIFVEFNVN